MLFWFPGFDLDLCTRWLSPLELICRVSDPCLCLTLISACSFNKSLFSLPVPYAFGSFPTHPFTVRNRSQKSTLYTLCPDRRLSEVAGSLWKNEIPRTTITVKSQTMSHNTIAQNKRQEPPSAPSAKPAPSQHRRWHLWPLALLNR